MSAVPLGFLAVGSTPGPDLPIEEFHDWYEGEHIPLRLDHLPSFLSGARYYAIDLEGIPAEVSQVEKTRWLAVYDIDTPATFSKPEYTSLREKRSQREAGVMARMGILTRICTAEVGVWSSESRSKLSTGFKLPTPTRWLVTYAQASPVTVSKDETKQSVQATAEGFEKTYPSWIRTRLFEVLESGVIGVWSTGREETFPCWVIHEFDDPAEAKAAAKAVGEGQAGPACVHDVRVWELYKAYRSLSQKGLD